MFVYCFQGNHANVVAANVVAATTQDQHLLYKKKIIFFLIDIQGTVNKK